MYDNELNILIKSVIDAGLVARGFTGDTAIPVKQSYQPTNQGANTEPTIYFHKLPDHRYGFLKRKSVWDQEEEIMVHTEAQWYESTFQINALATQNPKDPTALTANDIVNIVASIIQGDAGRGAFQTAGVGILRISEIRNIPFLDDRDRYEYEPSFDFTLTHEQVIISASPVITTEEFNIKRV